MNKTQKIIKRASELYKCMDYKELDNGNKRVIITERSGQNYDDLLAITFKVNEDVQLSMDSTYQFTMEALGQIADSAGEDIDGIQESIYEIEPDSYTSELTSWLNESNYHVYFIDEAIANGASKGFEALAMGQQAAKQETANLVLNWLQENIK